MNVRPGVALSDWCTLAVGGPALGFCQAANVDTVRQALQWAGDRSLPVHVLGGGSNVVFADEGFAGLVLHVDVRGIAASRAAGRVVFSVGAGEPWDPFVAATVAQGLAGLECLSGIPGQVGGTPIQNVGAYGQDVSATIVTVHAVDRRTLSVVSLSNAACAFGYRTSRFKQADRGCFVVTGVDFALAEGPALLAYADVVAWFERLGERSPSLPHVRDAILAIRRRKGMVIEEGNPASRSVGSFFVNPVIAHEHFERLASEDASMPHYRMDAGMVKVPAAWLIERAGFQKGATQGAAGVSPLQAQAIINRGGARASEIVALAAAIKSAVWEKFSILLVPEPVFVGFPAVADLQWLLESRSSGE